VEEALTNSGPAWEATNLNMRKNIPEPSNFAPVLLRQSKLLPTISQRSFPVVGWILFFKNPIFFSLNSFIFIFLNYFNMFILKLNFKN